MQLRDDGWTTPAEIFIRDNRVISHVDLDAFYAQVEMVRNPELKHRPVGVMQKTLTVTVNYLARSLKVPKMCNMKDAQKVCPDITMVGSDMRRYRDASSGIFRLFRDRLSLVERGSIDEAYFDLSREVCDVLEYVTSKDCQRETGSQLGPPEFALFVRECALKLRGALDKCSQVHYPALTPGWKQFRQELLSRGVDGVFRIGQFLYLGKQGVSQETKPKDGAEKTTGNTPLGIGVQLTDEERRAAYEEMATRSPVDIPGVEITDLAENDDAVGVVNVASGCGPLPGVYAAASAASDDGCVAGSLEVEAPEKLSQGSFSMHDVTLAVGAAITRLLRQILFREQGYTTSGGIGHNKLSSKIAGGFKKPALQTVVPLGAQAAMAQATALGNIPYVGRLLQGALADLGIFSVSDLANAPDALIQSHFRPEVAQWLINTGQGERWDRVRDRGLAKTISVQSATSAGMSDFKAVKILLMQMATELSARLLQDCEENERRPKTLILRLRDKDWNTSSRSGSIPMLADTTVPTPQVLYDVAMGMFRKVFPKLQFYLTLLGMGANNLIPLSTQLDVTPITRLFSKEGETAPEPVPSKARVLVGAVDKSVLLELPEDIRREVQSGRARTTGLSKVERKRQGPMDQFARLGRAPAETNFVKSVAPAKVVVAEEELSDVEVVSDIDKGEEADETSKTPGASRKPADGVKQTNAEESAAPKVRKRRHSFTCGRCGESVLFSDKRTHADWHIAVDMQKIEDRSNRAMERAELADSVGDKAAQTRSRKRPKKNAGQESRKPAGTAAAFFRPR